MRLAISFVGSGHPELLPSLYRWTAALMPAFAVYMRQKEHYYEHLEGVLWPEELSWLKERRVPPIAVLQVGGLGCLGVCWSLLLLSDQFLTWYHPLSDPFCRSSAPFSMRRSCIPLSVSSWSSCSTSVT